MSIRDLVKKVLPADFFRKVEPTGHKIEAMLEQTLFGFPARKLKVIGVTGTDGKTSTCTLIAQMLRQSGYKVAMMTTVSVDYGDGQGPHDNPTRLTSLGSLQLIKELKKVKKAGAEWLVLETTSHALAQNRVWGVPYTVAVMTNVSHEHLDYHGTFENYRDAKKHLFELTNQNKKGLQTGVINAEDPSADLFAAAIKNPISYGVKKGDLLATQVQLSSKGSSYKAIAKVKTSTKSDYKPAGQPPAQQEPVYSTVEYNIKCNLPGSFNVYNSLASVGVGQAIGLSKDQIEQGIASLQAVEGRMTRVNEGQDFDVIVDYAHTPESFEKIFKELKPVVKGRMIAVFGSAGRRDEAKRSAQGEIAGKYCDIVIATEEDDRDIDGQMIIEQIGEGAKKAGKQLHQSLFLVHNREEAVQHAIGIAQTGDLVVLLGKGHEKSILSNGPQAAEMRDQVQNDDDPRRVVKRPYDEVTVARAAIKKRLNKT